MERYDGRLGELTERYVAAHPRSRALMEQAGQHLPGGNTRSVLHFEPFPLVMESGWADRLRDVDSSEYIDCAGEFSAGLYGHSDPTIRAAIEAALDNGLVLGAPNRYEARLAELIAQRFPSLEQMRFCNSGTEANLLAVMTARIVTGRDSILVFSGAYHGGVLSYPTGGNAMNVPLDVVMTPFNDVESFTSVMSQQGPKIAAVLVEPVLGAAGNMVASQEFLEALRKLTRDHGALLIFDEVKTSRLGEGGMQGRTAITPDMTTLGKYLGGGLSFGAFGGTRHVMERFDPGHPDALKHAGTFNNNPLSLAAGIAGLREVFTRERAEEFLSISERFREELASELKRRGLPVQVSGLGSILSLHYGETLPRNAEAVHPATMKLRRLVHLDCLEKGVYLTARGDIFLSLPMTEGTLTHLKDSLVASAESEVAYL
ncbi:aspartate aminotransferase family protein [Fodinicurvata halophila]|uniref:Aspartate aminotransferase family protein n=2 Tax=Fodinicurvata halophila TaxID=1419723 RepID=A0ABV8UHL7_9PROT